MCTFFRRERKKKEKKDHRRQIVHQQLSCATLGGRGRVNTANDTAEQHILPLGGAACASPMARAPPKHEYVRKTHLLFFLLKK
jgi:hypothetical protein